MAAVPLLSILLAAAAPSIPATTVLDTVSEPHEVDQDTQADDVRFKTDVHDRMTVPVRVSGSGPFRFLVDTGSNRTAISSAMAARLGLELEGSAAVHTMTGIATVQTATVPNLRVSQKDVTIDDAPVLEAEKMGADGILGTDSLRSQRVVFDFDKRVMTIVPSEQRVARETGTIVVTGRLRNGRLIVTDAIADGNRITVVVDTGSEVSVGNAALRRRLGNAGLVKSSGPVQLETVTGDFLDGEYTFVKSLELGQVTLRNLAVVFADAHTFRKLGLERRPALLLGMSAFRAFRKVSIDFANRKLRVILRDGSSLDQALLAAR